MNCNRNTFVKSFLGLFWVALFSSYAGVSLFCMHTHVLPYGIKTHAHPFSNAHHSHSTTEINFIDAVMNFVCDDALLSENFDCFLKLYTLFFQSERLCVLHINTRCISLRAPPAATRLVA